MIRITIETGEHNRRWVDLTEETSERVLKSFASDEQEGERDNTDALMRSAFDDLLQMYRTLYCKSSNK